MNKKYEFLLGVTDDDELVFGEFSLEHPSYWKNGVRYTKDERIEKDDDVNITYNQKDIILEVNKEDKSPLSVSAGAGFK